MSTAGRPNVLMLRFGLSAALLVSGGSIVPSELPGAGLESIEIKSYYQPEAVQVAPSERPWSLPLRWQSVSNAAGIRGRLTLSSNACVALERNGLVVVPFGPGTNMIETYTWLREAGIPPFVTSDTLLHLYHVQFDDILKCVETNEFFPRLANMTTALLQESIRQRSVFGQNLQEAAARNVAFLGVAARLMGQSGMVPLDILPRVDEELALINAHAGFSASPIFKYQEDYSQYVPRGHYTRCDSLKQYFKVMMWYGRMAFLLKGSDHPGPGGEALVSRQDATIQTLQGLLLALALDRLQTDGQPIADTWNRIYAVTAFFVGLADDLTPYEYKDAMVRLFGIGVRPEDFSDEQKLFELKLELASLRSPEIYGGTGNCEVPADSTPEELDRVLDKAKGMRVMGQRFIPDSHMFQQLVVPVTGPFVGSGDPFTMEVTMGGPRRCFPRGLDVMAVLGSRLALGILDHEGDTAYLNYDASMNELVRQFNEFNPRDWHRNLYWAWLYTLRPLLVPCGPSYPAFMQTPAWQAKQLNTALASWTELRHDTILYAKQSYTAVVTGGPSEPDQGYAEPVPEFYQRLLDLTRMTRTGLDDLRALTTVQKARLLTLEDILVRLRDIAVTELELRTLTEAQRAFLIGFDKALAPLTNGIPDGIDSSTVLVADVHTDGNTARVLEEGVGYVNLLITACPLPNGGTILAVGPTMSYYEFKWPMGDRLTDERWAALLGGESPPSPPAWTRMFAEPVALPPEDGDGDRLPDAWEQSWWAGTEVVNDRTADPDGDGLTNEQEAIAGTDPTNPASALHLHAMRDGVGQVELRWQCVAGRTYRVHCSRDLRDWRLLGVPVAGSGETATLSDSADHTESARYYRLEVIP